MTQTSTTTINLVYSENGKFNFTLKNKQNVIDNEYDFKEIAINDDDDDYDNDSVVVVSSPQQEKEKIKILTKNIKKNQIKQLFGNLKKQKYTHIVNKSNFKTIKIEELIEISKLFNFTLIDSRLNTYINNLIKQQQQQ